MAPGRAVTILLPDLVGAIVAVMGLCPERAGEFVHTD